MNIRIEIKFFQDPLPGQTIAFNVLVDGVVVLPVAYTLGSEVVGVSMSAAIAAVRTALQTAAGATPAVYTVVGNSIFLDYTTDGTLDATDLRGELDYIHVYSIDNEAVLTPFDIDLISIEIIDTYTNERNEIENFAAADTIKLSWDSGDDLYSPMMTSKLVFTMLAENAGDGYFLHLLTGDERRYLVKVRTDADGVAVLIWQGYILPDQYSEPYKNGALFVQFTAVDMLATLKTKYFEPWFYAAVFSLPELLGYILAETGLQQEICVKNMLVNVGGPAFNWGNMVMSLAPFANGDKQDDLYKILEAVLTAQGMQICSYRGKWLLQGLTRRQEATGPALVYYHDGRYKETLTVAHEAVDIMLAANAPVITAETPWKKVNVNFETASGKNLFPDDVVLKKYYATRYRYDADKFDISNGFVNTYQNYWRKVGASFCTWSDSENPAFSFGWIADTYPDYLVTEPVALVNYFECTQRPYVYAGRRFEMEIEVTVTHCFTIVPVEEFIENLKGDRYNRILLFQLLLNGSEFLSNRPGYGVNNRLQFTKEFVKELPRDGARHFYVATYRLKYEFVVPENGVFTFRFLPAFNSGLYGYTIAPTTLRINAKDDVTDKNSVSAVRDINYTQELDLDVRMISTPDISIKNNFGITRREYNRYREIPVTLPGVGFYDSHYRSIGTDAEGDYISEPLPGNFVMAAYLNLTQYEIDRLYQDWIFRVNDGNKMLFLQKPDGTKIPFTSVYTKTFMGRAYLVAYNGFTPVGFGLPYLPDDYAALPAVLPGDKIMLMLNFLAPEDESLRALWKIYGFDDATAQSYVKTLAYACQCVRPDVTFSIDATALAMVFPLQRVLFKYMGTDRYFLPTRMDIDLYNGKTGLTMKEAFLQPLNDVVYE